MHWAGRACRSVREHSGAAFSASASSVRARACKGNQAPYSHAASGAPAASPSRAALCGPCWRRFLAPVTALALTAACYKCSGITGLTDCGCPEEGRPDMEPSRLRLFASPRRVRRSYRPRIGRQKVRDDRVETRAHWRHGPRRAAGGFPVVVPRITCDCCGKVQMVNETHTTRWRDRSRRDIHDRMRRARCDGLAGEAELLTGIGRPEDGRTTRN